MFNLLYPHQIEAADRAYQCLLKHGVCYLAAPPRNGKTRTALHAIAQMPVRTVLWVTPKQAIGGIEREVAAMAPLPYTVHVTNFEQVAKLNPSDYEFVVVDEAHYLGTRGKPSQRVKDMRRLAFNKPVLLISGTPSAETALALYHQFCITRHSPLKHKNFYEFFREWGRPQTVFVQGRAIEQYKLAKPTLLPYLEPYFVRTDSVIESPVEDVEHRFTLTQPTLDLLEVIKTDQVVNWGGRTIAFESDMAIRVAMHQVESGAIRLDGETMMLGNSEMAYYIKHTFGDSHEVAIMSHFIATREKLTAMLPRCHHFSSQAHATGVDLSAYKHLVIANTGYSGASHIQRRDRGTRIDIKTPRQVHHLMAAGQLSEQVYKSVSRKLDYNLETFRTQCLNQKSRRQFSTT